MNAYCDRIIGTIQREHTDHIIALSELHLLRTLQEFVEYYINARPHSSFDGNAPLPRIVDSGEQDIQVTPFLGGLHHTYRRAG